MMNHYAIQQRSVSAVCEEMIGREAVVCPKPVRVGVLSSPLADPIRTLRWNLSHQSEISEAAAGADLLDILLLKGGSRDSEQFCTPVDFPPPFFSGSPPSRVSNPLIQDARFREEKHGSPVSQLQLGPSSPSSYTRKGGYARPNFGNNPVVRIEGFACMKRDGRSSAVSARA
uniref:Uncharacterized protein n=1 Tax=Kalanchoe fedtschenkoi TaxID=63787 RepID=A0A7N0VBX6_KALFE